MKTNLIILFISVITICACSKNDPECYSCNEKIDAFVKENKQDLERRNVLQLAELDNETQKSAYRSFKKERKAALWREKIAFILKNIELSPAESEEIKKLYAFVRPDVIEDSEQVRAFVNEWVKRTKDVFLWDINRYKFLLFSLETDESKYLVKLALNGTFCDCNQTNNGIVLRDCTDVVPECGSGMSCTQQPSGCGYFWADSCNGICIPEGGHE